MSSRDVIKPDDFIDSLRGELTPILTDAGQSFDRLRTVFMIAVQQNPDILKCTAESLRREMSKCAADGLVPDSKEAVLLPYYDKEEKAYICNYQPMVHGIIKRLRELGNVFQITCNLVYANDTYEENEADPDSLVHKSPGFDKERGEIVGGYVIFRDIQKRLMHFEKMSKADFAKVRNASKSPNSPAWKTWFEEMCRKAVLRRGAKYLSTNNDKIRALIERQDSFFDLNAAPVVERINPFEAQTIDHDRGTAAIADQRGTAMPMDTGARTTKEHVESRGATTKGDKKTKQSADKVEGKSDAAGSENAGDGKKTSTLPDTPPQFPDVDIMPGDKDLMQEAAEKILNTALEKNLDPGDRRATLKGAVSNWKSTLPEYLHPLLKACIDMSDWAIRRGAAGQAWHAEHAQFAHRMKTLLGVEKLKLLSYS